MSINLQPKKRRFRLSLLLILLGSVHYWLPPLLDKAGIESTLFNMEGHILTMVLNTFFVVGIVLLILQLFTLGQQALNDKN